MKAIIIFTHNCHDFVSFCLKKIGFPDYNIKKFVILINTPPGKIQIKSYFDNNSFDIRGGKIEDGKEIILYPSHGRKNQIFDMIYNSDNTVTFKNGDFAISVKDGKVTDATIQISKCDDTAAQKFYLVNTTLGLYNIHSAINTNYAISIAPCKEEDKNKKYKRITLSYLYSQYSSDQGFRLIYK